MLSTNVIYASKLQRKDNYDYHCNMTTNIYKPSSPANGYDPPSPFFTRGIVSRYYMVTMSRFKWVQPAIDATNQNACYKKKDVIIKWTSGGFAMRDCQINFGGHICFVGDACLVCYLY
jgi:hypothetical protein